MRWTFGTSAHRLLAPGLIIAMLAAAALADTPAITTATLPHATRMVAYSQDLAATGGTAPYSWAVTGGTLPPNLTLDSTGTLSGVPKVHGSVQFQVTVTDSQASPAIASATLNLVIDQNPDSQGPAVSGLGVIPTIIRIGLDPSLAVLATASDAARGNSNIVAAEYYVGTTDPGAGKGTPIVAVDGAFDSTTEEIEATIATSTWTGNTKVNIRAEDAIENWGPTTSFTMPTTTDVTPPGAITTLDAQPVGTFASLRSSSHDFSSAGSGTPVTLLFDNKSSTYWQTVGTTISQTEYVTLDAGVTWEIGALLLDAPADPTLFPDDLKVETSLDGTTWTRVVGLKPPRKPALAYIWQWEPAQARYVKISGPGICNPKDKHYYWRIADAQLYQSGGPIMKLTFTAPANDGYAGTKAYAYDARWSDSPITEANFASCAHAPGLGNPKSPGDPQSAYVTVESTAGSVYIAVKTVDNVGNWSALSNVVNPSVTVSALTSYSPADATVSGAAPPTFRFRMSPSITATSMAFSSSLDFVSVPTARPDGQTDKSVRFPATPGTLSWRPKASQWDAAKAVVPIGGCLYWRLEGMLNKVYNDCGPARTVLFDSGLITGLAVTPSHIVAADEAVWPNKKRPPTFAWTNATTGMKYFYVDASTNATISLADEVRTVTLGGGVTGSGYSATPSEWTKLRSLATLGQGTLYWRVRAQDADRALTSASTVKKLVFDGGTWSVGDVNLDSTTPQVRWTHAGNGIAVYALEVSASPAFPATAKATVRIPSIATPAMSHNFSTAEIKRLKSLAKANGAVTTLYYRVRGEDGQSAFVTFSPARTTAAP